jgi:chromate reductase, NAD(P)H dehydrogenase (quinone)
MSQSPGTKYNVGYFVGSLSSTSINRILSRSLIRLAPPELQFTEIPIGNLPLYSPDHDPDYPPEARALKDAIARSDALLFVTRNTTDPFPAHSRTPSTGPRARGARTRSTTFRPP